MNRLQAIVRLSSFLLLGKQNLPQRMSSQTPQLSGLLSGLTIFVRSWYLRPCMAPTHIRAGQTQNPPKPAEERRFVGRWVTNTAVYRYANRRANEHRLGETLSRLTPPSWIDRFEPAVIRLGWVGKGIPARYPSRRTITVRKVRIGLSAAQIKENEEC